MKTSHRQRFTFALAALAGGVLAACATDESVDEAAEPTPAPASAAAEVCEAMQAYLTKCGAATPCDDALVADCADIVSIMSDDYLKAIAACIGSDQAPLACMQSSLSALTPSASHKALAATFCSECALGVPGCEGAFFAAEGSDSDEPKIGALLLPFGDDVVDQIAAECATGLTCATTFLSCAQGVLAKRALPEQSLQCIVDSLTNPSPPPAAGGCGTGSGSGSGSGGGTSGCNPVGRWQMQETLVAGNCDIAAEPFTVDVVESATGHDIVVTYNSSVTCAGSVDTSQCTANFTCPFNMGATGSYSVSFEGDTATGDEHLEAGCSTDFTIAGQRVQ